MKKLVILSAAMVAVLMLFVSCIDENYDLGDIDSTVEVKVVDLVVPLNLDEITLSSLITLNEGGEIREIGGEYVFVKEGEFSSDDVEISPINIAAPYIAPTHMEIGIPAEFQVGNDVLMETGRTLSLDVVPVKTEFDAITDGVTPEIKAIDRVGLDFSVTMTYDINGLKGVVNSYRYRNLKMKLPKGIKCSVDKGSYDAATGVYTLDEWTVTNSPLSIKFTFEELNLKESNAEFTASNHRFRFADEIAIESGKLEISSDGLVAGAKLPSMVTLENSYSASDVNVLKFTGRLVYQPTDLSPESFVIGDLPDIFSQPGTDLGIVNPQIYLSFVNPLYTYKMWADVVIDVMARRNAGDWSHFLVDDGSFRLDGSKSEVKYCLSPKVPEAYAEGYAGAQHVPFTTLSDVLRGSGLPDEIAIDVDKSSVPEQQVTDLVLGTNLGKFEGKYMFYAPLNLQAGSCVMYEDMLDGWNDEELDKMTVKNIEVSALVDNECPVSVQFEAYPIDVAGNRLTNVTVECSEVQASSRDAALSIAISGDVKHLDGMVFKATAVASDGNTLSPSMKLKLHDIKVKVSGSYITEL